MAKAAPKKPAEKNDKPQKPKGRPVRGAPRVEEEVLEKEVPTSSSPRHVVVEVEDETPKESATQPESALEAITTQNVAEAITTENPSEYVTVRKNVSSSRLFFVALTVGVLLGTLIFGGLVLFDTYGSGIKFPSSFTPTPTSAPVEPTPTEVVLQLSEYKVSVLNGSGIAGAAKTVSDLLTTAGFENVIAGNAGEFGYTDTEVQLKSTLPKALFSKIKKSLPGYQVVEVTSLPEDSDFDVVITVGKATDAEAETN